VSGILFCPLELMPFHYSGPGLKVYLLQKHREKYEKRKAQVVFMKGVKLDPIIEEWLRDNQVVKKGQASQRN